MSSTSKLAHIYNPANQSDEELLNGFIVRDNNLDKILKTFKKPSDRQHFLIEAQRGMGKTSLLLRIRIEIQRNSELAHLIPVQLAEEQYGIFNLCQLWEHIAEELEETNGFETLVDELDSAAEESNYPQEYFSILEKHLKQNKKQLVLLLDNFGDVLDRFSEIEQDRLRDIFHTSKHIQLIATSAKALEYTYKHDKSFYEFFQILHLKGMDKENTHKLLIKLAETDNQQDKIARIIKTQSARIETIRRLTGGVPRTIVLLYEIFMDESASVFQDLESILDRVTPLYKHRMDDLPTQQQAIMNALALNWDGMSTKEITEKINDRQFSSKKISSQLKQLEKNGLVTSKLIDKKNKLYFLQERFFNIWYLMRFGRKKNKNQVLWLVRFLQEWCEPEELKQRAKQHIKAAKEGRLDAKGGIYMAEALAPLINDMDLQHKLICETREALRDVYSDIDKKIPQSDKEKFDLGDKAYDDKNFALAIKLNKELIKKGYGQAMFNIAFIYHEEYKDYEQAIHYYKMATEKNHASAMYNLANLYYNEYKDYEQAIHYYKMAIEKNHAWAMNNLAILYIDEYKDYEQAIYYYKMAIEKDNASAMNNLALLYESEYKDYEQAIHYYKMAIEKDNAWAMNNLANLYKNEYKDYEKAIHYYKMAIEKDHAGAMNNLSWLYYTQAMPKEKQACLKLAEKSYSLKPNNHRLHTLATAQLWNNQYQASIDRIKEYLKLEDDLEYFSDDITDYFILLLAKKQRQPAYELFQQFPKLQDQFKPVYYALMTLLKDKYPKEYLKMGSELEETVQEILQKVEEKALKYA